MMLPFFTTRRRLSCFLLAGAGLLAVGCGGSGGGGGTPPVLGYTPAKVPIGWALRAREFGGPSSALSVVFTFDLAGTAQQNVALEADRSAAPAAYQQTFVTSQAVQLGIQPIHVRFYSQAGAQGSLVAAADASVLVKSDGTLAQANGAPLGTIQATGQVASLTVSVPFTLPEGTPEPILVNVYDSQNDLLAISSGSIFLNVVNQTGSATLNGSGQIVGNSSGTVAVTATVDGISCTPAFATVGPPPLTMTPITQATMHLAIDPVTGNIWATVPATDPTYGNSVIEIDPVTRRIVSTTPVGSGPTVLAFSDDGTALYVGLQGAGSFARVDPVGKTLVATYPLTSTGFGGSAYSTFIAVQPGNPNVVALSQESDDGLNGGCIYDNGVLLKNSFANYGGSVLGFTSATTLWGSNAGDSPPGLFKGTVGPTGTTLTNDDPGLGGFFDVFAGNLYFTNGKVVSGATGDLLGTYSALNPGAGVAVDLAKQTAYIAAGFFGYQPWTLQSFGQTNFKSIATYSIPAGPVAITDFSLLKSGQFVFTDGAKIYFAQLPPPPPVSQSRPTTTQTLPSR